MQSRLTEWKSMNHNGFANLGNLYFYEKDNFPAGINPAGMFTI